MIIKNIIPKYFSRSFTPILLVKDYKGLGYEGEVVEVKPG